ncbi:hypothetical protein COCC4DRAFT_23963 [Bipolaris maydis ATCC 48331]|uniref:Uncharacterized protein n=2 Tax=Cochliobolus heterostrophus TaxID=5016 RepID=M2UGP2_COCH5|nr:uncharacterized protein COCC4DRAFT_23963 [Bipolaris maydis ATCC 48331]EMD92851.1 hypothetical protein COCHEDRAFT_1029106 [Bipolaris maydis C5]ENI04760.1 hypothetical protein COCC4DRAFT_23963 [Bipolaris maydis ATCC 48331]KAJ6208297.1 hypothetical protein PSV09DRAFT_1029106 [Bipolaris maydis]
MAQAVMAPRDAERAGAGRAWGFDMCALQDPRPSPRLAALPPQQARAGRVGDCVRGHARRAGLVNSLAPSIHPSTHPPTDARPAASAAAEPPPPSCTPHAPLATPQLAPSRSTLAAGPLVAGRAGSAVASSSGRHGWLAVLCRWLADSRDAAGAKMPHDMALWTAAAAGLGRGGRQQPGSFASPCHVDSRDMRTHLGSERVWTWPPRVQSRYALMYWPGGPRAGAKALLVLRPPASAQPPFAALANPSLRPSEGACMAPAPACSPDTAPDDKHMHCIGFCFEKHSCQHRPASAPHASNEPIRHVAPHSLSASHLTIFYWVSRPQSVFAFASPASPGFLAHGVLARSTGNHHTNSFASTHAANIGYNSLDS